MDLCMRVSWSYLTGPLLHYLRLTLKRVVMLFKVRRSMFCIQRDIENWEIALSALREKSDQGVRERVLPP